MAYKQNSSPATGMTAAGPVGSGNAAGTSSSKSLLAQPTMKSQPRGGSKLTLLGHLLLADLNTKRGLGADNPRIKVTLHGTPRGPSSLPASQPTTNRAKRGRYK